MTKELVPYLKLIEFLGQILDHSYSIELYDGEDLSKPVASVNYKADASHPKMAKEIMESSFLKSSDYFVSSNKETDARKKASYLFIKNDDGAAIGLLAVYEDRERLYPVRDLFENLVLMGD